MNLKRSLVLFSVALFTAVSSIGTAAEPLRISGRYPHLTMYNKNSEEIPDERAPSDSGTRAPRASTTSGPKASRRRPDATGMPAAVAGTRTPGPIGAVHTGAVNRRPRHRA